MITTVETKLCIGLYLLHLYALIYQMMCIESLLFLPATDGFNPPREGEVLAVHVCIRPAAGPDTPAVSRHRTHCRQQPVSATDAGLPPRGADL